MIEVESGGYGKCSANANTSSESLISVKSVAQSGLEHSVLGTPVISFSSSNPRCRAEAMFRPPENEPLA